MGMLVRNGLTLFGNVYSLLKQSKGMGRLLKQIIYGGEDLTKGYGDENHNMNLTECQSPIMS